MNSEVYRIQNFDQSIYLVRNNLFFEIKITNLSKNETTSRQGILDTNGKEDRFQIDIERRKHESASQAVRYVENEIETRIRQGYQENKGQQDLPQQQNLLNLNFNIDDDDDKSHPQRGDILTEEAHTTIESENDGGANGSGFEVEEEEEILQDGYHGGRSQKKKSSRESQYGRSLILEALEDSEQSSPEILSKKIAKMEKTSQRSTKSRENSDKIELNKRDATIFLRPSSLENPQILGDLNKFYISQKYEGMSCYWDGTTLYTSSFKKCNPYQEFLQDFPKQKLIGQLIARNGPTVYQQIRSLAPTPSEKWLDWVFLVQDLHDESLPFRERLRILKEIKETQFIKVSPYMVFDEEAGLNEFIQSAKSRNIKEIYLRHPEGAYRGGCSGGFYSYAIVS